MTHLFVSFSVADDARGRDFVRQLLVRLQQQGIDPWIFESPSGEIEAGASIPDSCRRQIDQSDLFVVLITESALTSGYVRLEVEHAVTRARERQLPIVPLIATTTPVRDWPHAIQQAAAFKGSVLPSTPLDALESVVAQLCARLSIAYVPPQPGSPRLPLRQRLTGELQGCRSGSPYDVGDFTAILHKCDLAVEALGKDELARAHGLLQSILVDLDVLYGLEDSYYPRVVFGAVLMAEARAGRGSFTEVERYFAALIDERGEQLDANAFVARGHALMELNRFAEALSAYETAEPYLHNPDSALFYNILRARVLAELPMDADDIARRRSAIAPGLVARMPGDLDRWLSSLSLACAYGGDVDGALAFWRQIADATAVFPEVVVDICSQLHRQAVQTAGGGALTAARGLISSYIARRPDLAEEALVPLRHMWARVVFDRGDRRLARRQLVDLVARFPKTPVIHVDAAMFAVIDGDAATAHALCRTVTALKDASECVPAIGAREFNLALGHAFWLLGRRVEAEESFRRSGYRCSVWYESTMPAYFGTARDRPGGVQRIAALGTSR